MILLTGNDFDNDCKKKEEEENEMQTNVWS
jgi:hypothetical protein